MVKRVDRLELGCPTALPVPTPEHGSIAYDTKHLVNLVHDHVAADPRVAGKVLRTAVAPYLKREANSALISRLRKAASVLVFGDNKMQLQELPGIAAAMNGKGHKMCVRFWDKDHPKEDCFSPSRIRTSTSNKNSTTEKSTTRSLTWCEHGPLCPSSMGVQST